MKNILVLGSGCAKCKKTAEAIEKMAGQLDVKATVTKETSPQVLMSYGVMSTPAVVVNEKLVHSGSIPNTETIISWLKE
ncbi:thioredoxin family protein [Paraglaciecola arctica]|uniref:Redox-active disulfide protein 2 n=1 Tax=Paraglaciecola arctica BSs20135 TaxID=493475 RepID=K6XLR3_9ALTE|nr:thioredoxin family protein [Paraglaciecola arctica]GAC21599.1 redox-active disulfide protein 2 [Paraglaciecola arctica BSs20135]